MFDHVDFVIPDWAVNYIVNDDASGLTLEEVDEVLTFEHNTIDQFGVGSWNIGEYNEFAYTNDMNNVGGAVYEVKFMFEIKSAS